MKGGNKMYTRESGTTVFSKNEMRINLLWWQKRNLMYTASGYGKKIPTQYQVKLNNRWHRVYCCIFSNVGTNYIVVKGKDQIIDIEED